MGITAIISFLCTGAAIFFVQCHVVQYINCVCCDTGKLLHSVKLVALVGCSSGQDCSVSDVTVCLGAAVSGTNATTSHTNILLTY